MEKKLGNLFFKVDFEKKEEFSNFRSLKLTLYRKYEN